MYQKNDQEEKILQRLDEIRAQPVMTTNCATDLLVWSGGEKDGQMLVREGEIDML